MIKNTAGQKIGGQMVSASDGSAFTSAVTVSVTVDAGTQATGSVGAGACTHEGLGYHTYAPSQAETNGDLLAFTFTGTGAIPATVQVYTLTGDAYARLGAPAGASISADIAAAKVDTAAIKVKTDQLVFTVANQIDANVLDWKSATAPAMTGDAFARLGAPAGASVSADVAAVKVDTAAVKVKTDQLVFTVANQVDSNVLDWKSATAPAMTGDAFARLGAPAGASVSADIATVNSFIDTEVAAILAAVDTEVAAIKAKTDNLPEGISKNTALANFAFVMVDSSDHVTGKTGLTITAQRSIDGGAFAACANAASEIGNGVYKISLAATDTNGDILVFKFTATGADATLITIKTEAP